MPGWMKHKLETRLLEEMSVTSDMHIPPPLRQKWRGTKEPLDASERGEWKSWLETQHSHTHKTNKQTKKTTTKKKLNIQKWRSWHPVPSLHGKYMGKQWNQWETCLFIGRKAMTNLDSILKSRDITLLTKVCLVKAMLFPRVMLWKWEVDHKESWAPKNWCFWTAVLENTLESPLDCKEIQPVNPKRNQIWLFTGRTDAEPEAPILGPPDAKSWLIRKDPDAEKDWRQEKGMTEDEMVGCHHWLNGHEFEQSPGDGEGQGNLACCSPLGHKESDVTVRLNKNNILPASQSHLSNIFINPFLIYATLGQIVPICLHMTGLGEVRGTMRNKIRNKKLLFTDRKQVHFIFLSIHKAFKLLLPRIYQKFNSEK